MRQRAASFTANQRVLVQQEPKGEWITAEYVSPVRNAHRVGRHGVRVPHAEGFTVITVPSIRIKAAP